jgi:light-regulated signal transduction histidine kinase (bacteriophytochrome)
MKEAALKKQVQLEIKNKELEQFAYVASHDLQEPLRTVSNYIQILKEDCINQLDDTALHYINSINKATRRMSALVKALMDYSRLGRDKKLVSVNCDELVNNVIADLQTMIQTSGAIIDIGELPELNLYEVEIGQLFQNLITNAIKFQTKGNVPHIRISANKLNEKWHFSVGDNGIGIAPNHFQRIFEIFQRLHDSDQYEGNGIGLANCKKIIELHRGEIWLESKPGEGTTFHFTIPNLSV